MKRGACILKKLSIKRNESIRVTFLAYRDWALKVIENIQFSCSIEIVDLIKSEEEYKQVVLNYSEGYVDCVVLVGWSWLIKDDTLNRFLCVGIHPSDLPMYRGGSPIQHQIIDGLERTKISLMTISPDGVDVGDVWLKEEWDLSGRTMLEILNDLSKSTTIILTHFFNSFDSLIPERQNISKGTYCKRRKPIESKVTWEELSNMNLKRVYNLIRALGDPYPNIYLEDNEGNRLYFKEVAFVSNKKQREV